MVKSEVLASGLGELEINPLICIDQSNCCIHWKCIVGEIPTIIGYDTTDPNEQGPDITVTPEADVGSRQSSFRPKKTAAQNAREIIRVLAEDS